MGDKGLAESLEGCTRSSARSGNRTKVSGRGLRKTGIFANSAGDFWAFAARDRKKGVWRRKLNREKPAVCGPFASFELVMSVRRTAWLTSEGSNFHIPECKKPFEMSHEFLEFCREYRAGDF